MGLTPKLFKFLKVFETSNQKPALNQPDFTTINL